MVVAFKQWANSLRYVTLIYSGDAIYIVSHKSMMSMVVGRTYIVNV